MPIIDFSLDESESSITRPIVSTIVRELSEYFGYQREDFQLIFTRDEKNYHQSRSVIGERRPYGAHYNHHRYVEVDYTEEVNHNIHTPITWKYDVPDVFRDEVLGVFLKPIYRPMVVTLTLNYHFQDPNEARKWHTHVYNRLANFRGVQQHTLFYTIHLPTPISYILKEIHRLRENIAPYGESFAEYLLNIHQHDHIKTSNDITEVSNISGTRLSLAYKERQTRIYGRYDFPITPPEVKAESGRNSANTSITYKFYYHRPTSFYIKYPIQVHQELLDPKFLPIPEDDIVYKESNDDRVYYHNHNFHLEHFRSPRVGMVLKSRVTQPLYVPEFDEWWCDDWRKTDKDILQALLALDRAEYDILFDFVNNDYLKFSEPLLRYLSEEYKYLSQFRKTFFQMALYNQEMRVDHTLYQVYNDLKVRNILPLNLRHQYHLRLFVDGELLYIDRSAYERLRNKPIIIKFLFYIYGRHWSLFLMLLKDRFKDGYFELDSDGELWEEGSFTPKRDGIMPWMDEYWNIYGTRIPRNIFDLAMEILRGSERWTQFTVQSSAIITYSEGGLDNIWQG